MNEINTAAKSPPQPTAELCPRIVVLGVGGAGGNAVNNMIKATLEGVECVVANTDAQALAQSLCEKRVQLGINITQGLGAGSRPEIGRASAEEAIADVMEAINGAHMLFVTAGMGGGTGTGAAPVIAEAARAEGILTVGVVTKPFHFEGSRRMKAAEAGIDELEAAVDTLIVIPNQNLFRVANEKTTFADAFKMADDVLYSGVRGVTDLMVMPGLINLDFADIRAVMGEMGKAMMGAGEAEGDNRAVAAAEMAISNPLLDDMSLSGAKGVLINITGGLDMTLYEVDEAANRIRNEVDGEANIIFGSTFDESLDGQVRVSLFATGIEAAERAADRPAESPFRVVTPGAARGEPALARAQEDARPVPQSDMFVGPEADAGADAAVADEPASEPAEAPFAEPDLEPAAAYAAADIAEPGEAAEAPGAPEPAPADEPRLEPRFERPAEPAAPERAYAEPARPESLRPEPMRREPLRAEPPQARPERPSRRSVVDLVLEAAAREKAAPKRTEAAAAQPRAEVKPTPTRTPEEDVLEIPAFLRRQAN